MKYFTAEEARAVLAHNPANLCFMSDSNPNLEAMRVLYETVTKDAYRDDPYWIACYGFILGLATGKRAARHR